TGKGGLEPPPPGIQPLKLLKELQKEIRTAERQVIALNPPKPERESKRKKKKIVSDDFVDYTDLTSFNSAIEERLPRKFEKDDEELEEPQNGVTDLSSFEIVGEPQDMKDSKNSIKLTLPKPASYPYGVGIGMSGTPPHDPSYPPFKNDYPSNVKSEFDWTDSSEVSHKFIESQNVHLKMTRASLEEMSLSGGASTFITQHHQGPLRIKLGRENSLERSPSNSVYDFNDENDERDPPGLMIDESPKRKGTQKRNHTQQPLKIRFN
ncbi:hypothetical protein Anas_08906, partial [Armadillidium nasatum]